jgi:hypothetical protein
MDENLITLIKDYTTVALTRNNYFQRTYCKEGEELGLTFYWSLITAEDNFEAGLKYKVI